MDPNQDGYISTTTSGFSNDGYNVDEFEIPMFGLPISEEGEVLNDIQAGSNCGTTELTVDSKGFAVYGVLTTTNYLFFRFRVAKDRPSVEAYSILIDTDGKTGAADPNSTANNPGFEIDITLIKNQSKGIYVYNIDGIESCPVELLHYGHDTNFQIAVADEVSCGDPDFFYDFYVPFADVASLFNISTATELRFVALTNVSATCAMGGKISDIGGVDDGDYAGCNSCAFIAIAENQCPTALSNLCPTCQGFPIGVTPKPTINVPLKAGEFEISGTSLPSAEVYLGIFFNDGSLKERDTTVSDVDGNWVSMMTSSFNLGDSITAQARAIGQCNSGGVSSGTSFTIVVENQEPVLGGPAASLSYSENALASAIAPSITVTDTDDVEIDGAVISITGNYAPAEDVISCSPPGGIAMSYDATTGTITLSGISSLANYQSALRSVTYSNSSDDPSPVQRTVVYMVNDGLANSSTFTALVDVVPVNDVPALTSATNTVTFSGALIVVNNGFTITDADHAQLAGATVSISNNFVASEDVLSFADQNGITGSYDAATGILTLSGNASLADYGAAISSVEYNNTAGAPSLLTRRVSFVVSDGTNNSNTFNSFVDFPSSNNPPDIVDENGNPIGTITFDIDEDTELEECISVNDPDGDPVVIDSFTNQVGAGLLTITGDLCFKYVPPANFNGQVTATITACDQTFGSLCDMASLTINVLPVNDAPVVTNANATTVEDNPVQICVAFTDVEGDNAFFSAGTLRESSGAITNPDPTDLCFTYSPNPGFVGKDTVDVTICDPLDNTVCAIGQIYIVVTPAPNHKPEILINGIPGDTLFAEVQEDSVAIICFEAIDPEGDDVALGTVTKNSSGGGDIVVYNNIEFCFEYSPVANFNGQISWTVDVCDDGSPSECGSIVILLDVIPVNDPPVIVTNTITTAEDSVLNVCLQITDVENDPVGFVQAVSRGERGTLADDVLNDQCFTFTTPFNSDGTDTLDVTVCDINVDTVCTTKSIIATILPRPNLPPVISIGGVPLDTLRLTVGEDNKATFCLDVTDPNQDGVVVDTFFNNSGGGTLTDSGGFCFEFSPPTDYNGESIWEVYFCDNETPPLCADIVIVFDVTPVNDPPVILTNSFVTLEDSTATVCLQITDVEGDPAYLTSATSALALGTITNGTLTDLCFDFTTTNNVLGTDSLTVTVCDVNSASICSTKKIGARILPRQNLPPDVVIGALPTDTIEVSIDEDELATFCLSIIDPNDDNVTLSQITENSGGGSLSHTGNFCFSYLPAQDYNGVASWRINFCDDESPSLCGFVAVLFTINPINDPPTGRTDTLIALRNEEGTINLLTNDTDIDGDQLSLTPQNTETISKGKYSLQTDGTFQYRSDRYFKGAEEVFYEVCDDGTPQLCSEAIVKVLIEDLPLKPYEAFSPNNDGNNDYWRIEGVDFYPHNLVQIFDRFNNLVFQLRNYNNEDRTWNGSSNNGLFTGELPEGTYFYSITLEKGEKPMKGFVVLKRQ
jgi:gliding motility-associated-like protein